MRRSTLLGTALIVVGGAILLRGLSIPVARAGDRGVPAKEWSPIARVAAGLAVVGGLFLVIASRRPRRNEPKARSRYMPSREQ